jgi:hypothetical protein
MKKPEVIKQNSLWKPDSRILFLLFGVIVGSTPSIYFLPRLHRAEASAAMLHIAAASDARDQIRASRPINCAPYYSGGSSTSGYALLGDPLLERTEQPEVCHLRPEAERLGLVPKSPI